MDRQTTTKLQMLENRYVGLCRQVDAMLETGIPLRTIAAVLEAQYGERVSHSTIWKYRRNCWCGPQKRTQPRRSQAPSGKGRSRYAAVRSGETRNSAH
jgi:hypothetical protein